MPDEPLLDASGELLVDKYYWVSHAMEHLDQAFCILRKLNEEKYNKAGS